mmetsp:Transcript_18954/g.44538  ORF Transcript_18954/g.44538 Transcript_18954/m.44538 type:complete len:224 (+) Transcript_18954:293-964(+)
MSVKMSYSFMYKAKDFCLEALDWSSKRRMISFALRRGGGSRLMSSAFVAQVRARLPVCKAGAEPTRGKELVSWPILLARPAANPPETRLALPTLLPPSSSREPALSSAPFARSAGMLRGRTCIGLVDILSKRASDEALRCRLRSLASLHMLIWQGETQVVLSSRVDSEGRNLSTTIFLCNNSCRSFRAFSSLALASRAASLAEANLAADCTAEGRLMARSDLR